MTSEKNSLLVWAFQHVGYEDLGSFEAILMDMGADIRYICGRREDLTNLDASEPDILVVLGGPMGLYESDQYPYLIDEIKLVEQRLKSNKPMLGICLGAQIIAKALGANVYKGAQGQQIGWQSISVNERGMETPLRHLDAAHTNMMHWHSDTFDMPQGVELLATSELYPNQAYSYGTQVLAVQCHPEITPKKLDIWLEKGRSDLDEVAGEGLTAQKLLEDTQTHGATLKSQAYLFFTEWMRNVLPPEMLE